MRRHLQYTKLISNLRATVIQNSEDSGSFKPHPVIHYTIRFLYISLYIMYQLQQPAVIIANWTDHLNWLKGGFIEKRTQSCVQDSNTWKTESEELKKHGISFLPKHTDLFLLIQKSVIRHLISDRALTVYEVLMLQVTEPVNNLPSKCIGTWVAWEQT